MRPLFDRLPAGRAQTYHVVLASAAIPHQLRPHGRFWAIDVPQAHRGRAVQSVALYLAENPPAPPPLRHSGQRTYSALFVIAALTAIHWAVQPGLERQFFFKAYGADAGKILDGQYYRCITALLVHADGAHLLSNAAGLAIFGTAVASVCGWGVGWFMILAAGALGNLGAALWYAADHLAVGSSTALFGAVAISAMLTFRSQLRRGTLRSFRAWAPLGGGLALLGFLGTGPATDLLAHLAGFFGGLAIGGAYVAGVKDRPGVPIQVAGVMAGLVALAAAWVAGLYSSG